MTITSHFETTKPSEIRALLDELNRRSPEELLRWAAEEHGDRAAIITSFQDTGCVTIDLACRYGVSLRVITVDSLRLHPETYALMDRIEERYGIEIERFQPYPERVKEMIRKHGEYLFFDSKAKQEYCCHIRKVEPNTEALKTVDVWITGLRRDHSDARSGIPKATIVQPDGHKILKLAPLAEWDAEQVWEYIKEHDVPYNELYDRNYTSIGCIICSTPTMPWEDRRAGRWRWQKKEGADRECGIHDHGSGI
jgi:phosphoadenylyl-sulfate reductase (thioredoxin)